MHKDEKGLRTLARNARGSREHADIVIVGNGIAGLTAAVEARSLAPQKRIVIITKQSHPTIHTPALKQFATGKLTQEQLLAYPAGTERTQQIEVINNCVEEIRSREKYLRLSDGRDFGYGSLLLATGSKPNGLPAGMPGRDFDGVLTLHRLSDYLDLRRRLRLREIKEAVVIGGGTHAIETVMVLLHWGIRVRWMIRGSTFLSRILDRTASDMVLERTRAAGATIQTETEVVGIVGKVGAVAGVVTNHQQVFACQMVVVCTGVTPVTTLAEHCDVPLKRKQGLLVDDQQRTSVQHIYAAGDVATLKNPLTGAYQTRPHWQAAVLQGRTAATVMTGRAEFASPPGVQWLATQVGEYSLLSVSDPLGEFEGASTITDKRKESYRRLSICGDRLVSYLALGNAQPDSLAIKRIIDEGLSIRDIEKTLLTGVFDTRLYFAQKHSYAAQRMVTTGELPVLGASDYPRYTDQKTPVQHDTDALPQLPLLQVDRNRGPQIVEEMIEAEQQLGQPAQRQSPATSSVKSLMSKRREPAPWIVPGVLPHGLIALAGRQRIGKSWFNLSLGLGIAAGSVVLGSITVKKGDVLYLALEDTEQSLQERIHKLVAHGASLSNEFEYATSWPAMDADGPAAIESWLVVHPHARLIMIDSWNGVQSNFHQPADTSGYPSDYAILTALQSLASIYHVCIMVQFHAIRAVAGDPFDALNAVTSVTTCADGLLHLKRANGSPVASLTGTGEAYRSKMNLALSFNDGLWSAEDNATARRLSGSRKAVIDVLNRSNRPMKPKEVALALGKQDNAVRKMLFDMKASKLIKETDEGYLALIHEDNRISEINGLTERNTSNDEAPLLIMKRLI
jgi:NADPH-dependent 2,4-dienoyl-CoA reductase/sulfur reductase-like enzyme